MDKALLKAVIFDANGTLQNMGKSIPQVRRAMKRGLVAQFIQAWRKEHSKI